MKTLLGMRLYPGLEAILLMTSLSLQARAFLTKCEGTRKWLLGLHVVFSLVMILMIGYLVQSVVKMGAILQGGPAAHEICFIMGLFLGWISGHQLTAAVRSFIDIAADTMDIRTKRLLRRWL